MTLPFPIDTLPPRSQEAIKAQAALGNYPVEAVGTAALAIMAHAAQGLFNVADPSQIGRAYPLSQFYMVLVPSGDAKSSIYANLMVGVKRWQTEQELLFAQAEKDYAIDLEEYTKALKKLASAHEKKAFQRDHEPTKPRHRHNILSKATTNGIYKTLNEGWPTLGLFSAEGGSVLHSHSLNEKNAPVEFASAVNVLWDEGAADRTTGEVSVRLRGKRLSVLLMVQPEIARGFLQNAELAAHGIHARFGIVAAPKWQPLRVDFTDPAEEARKQNLKTRIDGFNERIYELVSGRLPLAPERDGELAPATLEWSVAAKKCAVGVFDQCMLKRDQSDETYWKRLFEHVCRTAGVLSVFEGEREVTQAAVEAAWALVQFYADQWQNLNLTVGTETDTSHAKYVKAILRTIKQKGGEATRRDLLRATGLNADKAEAVLTTMIKGEYIEYQEIKNGTRTTHAYRALNP
jgi:hypothetical protein